MTERLMATPEERARRIAKLRAVRLDKLLMGHRVMVLDRSDHDMFDWCEGPCGRWEDCRPYGRGGKWMCHDCSSLDKAAQESRAMHYMFGDALKPGT